MSLITGRTLACHEILGSLGVGGMAEVNRARDTRLEREVAIKVLPEGFAADPVRLRRFQRDARTMSSHADGTGRGPLVEGAVGPAWSADGAWVYYTGLRGATERESNVYRVHVDSRRTELVRRDAVRLVVSSDGGAGYYIPSYSRIGEIWKAVPLATERTVPLRQDLEERIPMRPHQYVLSPDDQWLAGPLKDGETSNLYRSSTADGRLVPVTDFGQRRITIGRQVAWSRDGQWLYAAVMESDDDIVLLEGTLQ